jgi:hypothetical protein
MDYDDDKTSHVIAELRDTLASGSVSRAIRLLRHADSAGGLCPNATLHATMKEAVGEKSTAEIVSALAEEPCPYCRAGREPCQDCSGSGHIGPTRICRVCAGLGLRRCPFCNGTALAGYSFVPSGLRPAVVASRLALAAERIRTLAKAAPPAGASARDLARRIVELDRYRGMLANAVEQVRMHAEQSTLGRVLYTASTHARVEKEARRANAAAEPAIRALFQQLAEHSRASAQRPGRTKEERALRTNRAKAFAEIAAAANFDGSSLATPRVLRGPSST